MHRKGMGNIEKEKRKGKTGIRRERPSKTKVQKRLNTCCDALRGWPGSQNML
jgi:hypothetical protein